MVLNKSNSGLLVLNFHCLCTKNNNKKKKKERHSNYSVKKRGYKSGIILSFSLENEKKSHMYFFINKWDGNIERKHRHSFKKVAADGRQQTTEQ